MKIVYMGTPDFAVAPLNALIRAGHEVTLVLTGEDKPRGRGQAVHFPPVKEAALAAGIPVLQPRNMRDPSLLGVLRESGAELFVVAAYGKLLPGEILSIPRFGCVNLHGSLLPEYRGAAPIQQAVIDGREKTGITTMRMDEGLDTGDILRQYPIPIATDETGGSLFEKLAALAAEAILDTISGLVAGEIEARPQGEQGSSYAPMLKKEMGNICWTDSAARIERRIRGLSPWPGCYSFLNGTMLKIWKAQTAESEPQEGSREAEPGTISALRAGKLWVQTGDGLLILDEVQPEGKKRMRSEDYLRGARIREGARFSDRRSG